MLDDDSQSEEDEHLARAQPEEDEHLARSQPEEDEHLSKVQLEEDEQLARALQESMNVESPPRYDSGNIFQPFFLSGGYRYMWSLCHLWYTTIYMLVALTLSLLRFQQVQLAASE